MIEIDIPGFEKNRLSHLVLDYNGTLAVDGQLITGVKQCLIDLSNDIHIHILTAGTFGSVKQQLEDITCELSILPTQDQANGKLNYVNNLGAEQVVSIGNGRNDRLMLKRAAIGIVVILTEGAAVETILAADLVFTSILDVLEFLKNPYA